MSRISRLDRSEVSAEMAALYDRIFALRMEPTRPGEGGCTTTDKE